MTDRLFHRPLTNWLPMAELTEAKRQIYKYEGRRAQGNYFIVKTKGRGLHAIYTKGLAIKEIDEYIDTPVFMHMEFIKQVLKRCKRSIF